MTDWALDLDDIQGDILGGFNTDVQELVGLGTATSATDAAARWLALLASEVTTVSQVRAQRDLIKSRTGGDAPTWLALAVSKAFLGSTASDVVIRDQAFFDGMPGHVTSSLGDRSTPEDWRAGSPSKPIDILLKVAGNDEAAVRKRADDLVERATASELVVNYRETGRRLPGDKEHFGFRDGISQPDVVGYQSATGLGPGRFVFGYPRDPGGNIPALAVDPRNVTRNGSMLVFRRLAQDVGAFRAFCDSRASALQQSWPGLTPELVQALIVGRWPSGAPAHPKDAADPGVDEPDNSFDFHGDDDGALCPFGSHIRKVNPRKGKSDVVDVPRLLRRSIPFGQTFDDDASQERGLLFMAYQASITSTFLFISSHWMNSPNSPGDGDDILLGRPYDERRMPVLGPNGPVEIATAGSQWIKPTGGAYLFAPGIAGIRKLATAPNPLMRFNPTALVASTTMRLRQFARFL